MVKAGIIYNDIFSSEIESLYKVLTKLNFEVFVISSTNFSLDVPNKIIKDIESKKDEFYVEHISVFINFDEKDYKLSNFTFYNLTSIPRYTNKNITLEFNKKYTLEYNENKIISGEDFIRELLINNSSINVIEYNNDGYIFKNNRITEILTNKKTLNNRYKFDINVNVYCSWTSSKDIISSFKRFAQKSKDNVHTWNFKNHNLNLTCDVINPDFNYVMNATNEKLSNNTLYVCMEPPGQPQFEHYYNISKNANVTFYGTHKYHQNMIDWHLSKNISELSLLPCTKVHNKVLSIIVSDYYRDPGHKLRIDFIRELDNRAKDERLPFELHIYGRCKSLNFHCYKYELLNGKDEGLFPYKYHFNAENISVDNYVTEKFNDAILSECLMFYWGCPNLETLYNKNSFVRLTLLKENYEKEIEMINTMMNNNEHEKRLQNILSTKQDILYNRSVFVRLNNIIQLSSSMVFLTINVNEGEVKVLKDSCFKLVAGFNLTENTAQTKLNIMQMMLKESRDCILINKYDDFNSIYSRLSTVCLDTHDIVYLTKNTDDIFLENVWIKISVLEEIYMHLVQLYHQQSNKQIFEMSFTENLKMLLKMKKYQIN